MDIFYSFLSGDFRNQVYFGENHIFAFFNAGFHQNQHVSKQMCLFVLASIGPTWGLPEIHFFVFSSSPTVYRDDELVPEFYTVDLWSFLFIVGGLHTRGKTGAVPWYRK